MDVAYLHLITNHVPIIGLPFALAVLAVGIWRRSDEIKALGFLAFAVLALATVGVFLLGQGGEDFIEELPGVSHNAIEDHEGVAMFALASVLLTGAAALFALLRYKGLRLLAPAFRKTAEGSSVPVPGFPTWIVMVVLAIGVISSGVLGYTGRLGGKIRHPEFHDGAGGAQTGGEADEENEGGKGRRRTRGER